MPFAARCYVAAVFTLALGVIAALPWSRTPLFNLGVLVCLTAAFERLSHIRAGRGTSISVSMVASLASMLILPPSAAAVVGVISALSRHKSGALVKSLFNAAMFGVVLAAGSQAYLSLGGHDGQDGLHFPSVFLPYFTAVAACWLLNGLMLAAIISLTARLGFWAITRDNLVQMAFPYFSSSALSLIMTALWGDGSFGVITALLVIVPMYIAHWVLSQQSLEQDAYESTINALVHAVEIKDRYTRGHSERVAKGAELIARRMEFTENRIAKLRYAGLLHDIGKLSVPTRLLEKTGKLTDEEYREIQLHPNHGVAVVRDITFLTEVYEAILYHHERLDGRGYPQGRRGDEIPEFARVIGVADAFDAMTSTRSYRAARPVTEAVAELWRGAGTQFDPEIVRALDEALDLQAKAGHPWQITEKPAEADDGALAARTPAPQHEYSFGDHDDPSVNELWYSGPRGELPPPPEPIDPGRLHSGPNLLTSWPDRATPSLEDDYPRIGAGRFQIRERPDRSARPDAPATLDRRLDDRGRAVNAPHFTDADANADGDAAGADEFDDDRPDAEIIFLHARPAVPVAAPPLPAPDPTAVIESVPAPEAAPIPRQTRADNGARDYSGDTADHHDAPTVEMPRVQNTGSAE